MLGGNLGDTLQKFREAIKHLAKRIGPVSLESKVYFSEPWGNPDQPVFMNQALVLKTTCSPRELLKEIKLIEQFMGRFEGEVNGPRLIDIDILLMDEQVYKDEKLEIPHPRLHLRNFNLVPLAELTPSWMHPVFKKSIAELRDQCSDTLKVYEYYEPSNP